MSSCCCGLGRCLRSFIRSRSNKHTSRSRSFPGTRKVSSQTALEYRSNTPGVPVQCTDHDEPQILEKSLDGTYKTTGGLQLKRAYMVYMYE